MSLTGETLHNLEAHFLQDCLSLPWEAWWTMREQSLYLNWRIIFHESCELSSAYLNFWPLQARVSTFLRHWCFSPCWTAASRNSRCIKATNMENPENHPLESLVGGTQTATIDKNERAEQFAEWCAFCFPSWIFGIWFYKVERLKSDKFEINF